LETPEHSNNVQSRCS